MHPAARPESHAPVTGAPGGPPAWTPGRPRGADVDPRGRGADGNRSAWRSAATIGAWLAVLGLVVAGGSLVWLWQHTPDAADVAGRAAVVPSRIVAADGPLPDALGERRAQPVTLDQVSPHLVAALLATEDHRFHHHPGVDPVRLVRAALATLSGDIQGGSTLTQQLARNLFPRRVGHQRSLGRKLRELVVALKIEQAFDKRQILTMYLNQVQFRYHVSGVELAARTTFDKPAADLEAQEAALLVALLKGPGYYDPLRWPQRAQDRRNLVLALMRRAGALGELEARRAMARPLDLRLRRLDGDAVHAPPVGRPARPRVPPTADAKPIDPSHDGRIIPTLPNLLTQRRAQAEGAARRQTELLQTLAERG